MPALETRGTVHVMAGQPYEAVRTLARARALARRTGLRWPWMDTTLGLLASAESQLGAADTERAYREGNLDVSHPGEHRPAGG